MVDVLDEENAARKGAAGLKSAPLDPPAGYSQKRYFELFGANGKPQKFWEIDYQGDQFVVRYGKSGGAAQTSTKAFPDASRAQQSARKLITEKVAKGYVEKVGK
jgi:predicted DNA-binding WGR domain protein